ncbi:MAG: hypothetical protein RLN62_05275 [Rickettsiales bacterium]
MYRFFLLPGGCVDTSDPNKIHSLSDVLSTLFEKDIILKDILALSADKDKLDGIAAEMASRLLGQGIDVSQAPYSVIKVDDTGVDHSWLLELGIEVFEEGNDDASSTSTIPHYEGSNYKFSEDKESADKDEPEEDNSEVSVSFPAGMPLYPGQPTAAEQAALEMLHGEGDYARGEAEGAFYLVEFGNQLSFNLNGEVDFKDPGLVGLFSNFHG